MAQHHDLVRHLGDDGEVVGDVERGDAGIADGVLDGGQHVDLRGHVERRRRLVEDDQVGLRAQRHGGHDALQLAAGNLVREALADMFRIGQAELLEQRDGALFRFRAAALAVQQRRLDDLVHQPVGGIEGRRSRLRDVADFLAAQLAEALLAALQDIAAVEDDLAAGDPDAAAAIAHRRKADGRFAGAGLADQAEHLAAFQGQRDVVNEHDVLRRLAGRIDARLDAQIADVEQELRLFLDGCLGH